MSIPKNKHKLLGKTGEIFLVSMSMTMLSCSEDIVEIKQQEEKQYLKESDIEINFGGQTEESKTQDNASSKLLASFEEAATRVGFADSTTNGIKTSAQWQRGDKITISQTAGTRLQSGYFQTPFERYEYTYQPTTSGVLTSELQAVDDNVAKWLKDQDDNPLTNYRFVATYPQKGNKITDILYDRQANGTEITGFVPRIIYNVQKNQTCTVFGSSTSGSKVYYTKPDMTNYYMIGTNDEKITSIQNSVHLTFKPAVSTLVLQLKGRSDANTEITGVKIVLVDKNKKVRPFPDRVTVQQNTTTGNWTKLYAFQWKRDASNYHGTSSNLKDQGEDGLTDVLLDGIPEYTQKEIYVTIRNGNNNYLVLKPGEAVNVTVFLPPLTYAPGHFALKTNMIIKGSADDPTINQSFSDAEVEANATLRYNAPFFPSNLVVHGRSEGTKLEPGKKAARRQELREPIDYSRWMSYLPGTLKLTDLSIPGAFRAQQSKLIPNGKTYNYTVQYYPKNGNIGDLLNGGCRALYIPLTANNGGDPVASSYNAAPSGDLTPYITPTKLLTQLEDWLKQHPTETIIILTGREPISNLGSDSDPRFRVSTALRKMSNSSLTVQYQSGLTLAQCRGKMVYMMRPDIDSEKENANQNGFYTQTNNTVHLNSRTGVDFIYVTQQEAKEPEKFAMIESLAPSSEKRINNAGTNNMYDNFKWSYWFIPKAYENSDGKSNGTIAAGPIHNKQYNNSNVPYWKELQLRQAVTVNPQTSSMPNNTGKDNNKEQLNVLDFEFLRDKESFFTFNGIEYGNAGNNGDLLKSGGSAYNMKGDMAASFIDRAQKDNNLTSWYMSIVPGFMFAVKKDGADRYDLSQQDGESTVKVLDYGQNRKTVSKLNAWWDIAAVLNVPVYRKIVYSRTGDRMGIIYLNHLDVLDTKGVFSSEDGSRYLERAMERLIIQNNFQRIK